MWRGGYSVTNRNARSPLRTEASSPRAKRRAALALAVCLAVAFVAGCGKEVDPFPAPGNVTEAGVIMRQSSMGPIIVVFCPYPLDDASPSDGVRSAVIRAIGGENCSAAAFHWTERAMAERWVREQLEVRRLHGTPLRIILAGHSLGATTAAETARDIMTNLPDVVIPLLLTVDAIKTGRISSTAGVTGAFIASASGIKTSFTAYDSAPTPDGRTLRRHVNYYQKNSDLYHGSPMPGAENHLLHDTSGLLNHGNADDFALPLLVRDIHFAMTRGAW